MKWERMSFLVWALLGRPCPNCYGAVDSVRHHIECVAPLDQIEGGA